MIFSTLKVKKETFEIKQGWNGSGKSVFFIYWEGGDIDGMDCPFKSEAEAVANAICLTKCGERVW